MRTRPIVSESLTGSHVSVAKYVQFMLTCLRRNMLNIVLCEPQESVEVYPDRSDQVEVYKVKVLRSRCSSPGVRARVLRRCPPF
jgi:hypothetical protein